MKILLRIVAGAPVALVVDSDSPKPEMLPTRYDLFKYRGGVAWGYKGTGVQNLGYSIAARLSENMPELDIHVAARSLVDNLLSKLPDDMEHIIDQSALLDAVTPVNQVSH